MVDDVVLIVGEVFMLVDVIVLLVTMVVDVVRLPMVEAVMRMNLVDFVVLKYVVVVIADDIVRLETNVEEGIWLLAEDVIVIVVDSVVLLVVEIAVLMDNGVEPVEVIEVLIVVETVE